MADHFIWEGASGKKYNYSVHKFHLSFKDDPVGNYIFCKFVKGEWVPIYIGEGIINDRKEDEEHKTCALGKGVTHIHAHKNSIEENRCAEEQDLLAAHPEAYDPIGCNVKPKG